MFLILAGGTLILGTGLLAAASYSEGTLVAARTAALVIGWLFVLSILGLRRASLGELTAAAVTLSSGVAVLYLAYFEWGATPPAAIRHAAAETVAAWQPDKLVHPIAIVAPTPVARIVARETPVELVAVVVPPPAVADRCAEERGLSRLMCRETLRLEHCEKRQGLDPSCPSAIPYSPPQ